MPVKNELMKEVNKNITERQKVGRREKRRETVKKRVKKKDWRILIFISWYLVNVSLLLKIIAYKFKKTYFALICVLNENL